MNVKKQQNYCFLRKILYICQKYISMITYKILMFILMFSILVVIKDLTSFVISFIKDEQANFSSWRMLGLGLSLSYILTIIFSGFDL